MYKKLKIISIFFIWWYYIKNMSSTNYKLLHTRDERLTNQPVHFAVKTGGSSVSNVEYNAQSKSTTSHSWQINPPAGVFIDRRRGPGADCRIA